MCIQMLSLSPYFFSHSKNPAVLCSLKLKRICTERPSIFENVLGIVPRTITLHCLYLQIDMKYFTCNGSNLIYDEANKQSKKLNAR